MAGRHQLTVNTKVVTIHQKEADCFRNRAYAHLDRISIVDQRGSELANDF